LLGQQHAGGGQLVFHILEGGQHGLTVGGHCLALRRLAAFDAGAGGAGIEQGLRCRQAQRPGAAGQAEQVGHAAGANTVGRAERQAGVVGALGNADLRVRHRHPALGAGNVGPALQQGRGQADRHVGHGRAPGGGRQAEVAWRFANQHCNGMLQLGALAHQPGVVGLGAGQLGLRLQHVGLGGNAGGVAVLRDVQGAPVAVQRGLQQRLLRVELAQRQVVDGEFALRRQPGRGQIGSAGLGAGRCASPAPPQPVPHIRLPAGADADVITVAGAPAAGRATAAGAVRAAGAPAEGDRRKQRCTLLAHQRPGSRIGGHGLCDVLVRHLHPGCQLVKRRVAEQLPPRTAFQRIGRRCGHPAGKRLVGGDFWRGRTLVGRADGAAAQRKNHGGCQQVVKVRCEAHGQLYEFVISARRESGQVHAGGFHWCNWR